MCRRALGLLRAAVAERRPGLARGRRRAGDTMLRCLRPSAPLAHPSLRSKTMRRTGRVGGEVVAVMALSLLGSALVGTTPSAAQNDAPTFYADVLPILRANCQVCHQSGDVKTG